jgi:hypothetical protein
MPENLNIENMENHLPMQTNPRSSIRLAGFALILSVIEAAAAAWYIFQIPGDTKNVVLLGLSAQRLGLVGFLLLGLIICGFVGTYCLTRSAEAGKILIRLLKSKQRVKTFSYFLLMFIFLGWAAIFIPSYQTGRFQAYFERLQPVFLWLGLLGGQIFLVLLFQLKKFSSNGLKNWKSPLIPFLPPALWTFGSLVVVWIVISITGLGLKPDSVHWNDAGAPLLAGQILFTFFLGLATWWVERRLVGSKEPSAKNKRIQVSFDIIIFLLIWAAAAIIWIKEPLPHSFFAPGPYPPNNEPYPFSDATVYDLSAQFALIGQGLMNKEYVDKPLYSGFLVLLHVLAGQHYYPVINLQTAFIAIFPALLFLLGKMLHSRAAGVMAAFLTIFRELNSIGATLWILSSSSRVMMSEPLTTVGIAFFVYFLVRWVKKPENGTQWLVASGGTLGLTTLVRHNPWLLIPVGLVIILLVQRKNWRRWLLGSIVFILAFVAAITPWMVRNQIYFDRPFYFLAPLEGVVMIQRYNVRLFPVTSNTPIPDATNTPSAKSSPENAAQQGVAADNQTATAMPVPAKSGTSLTRLIDRVLQFVPAHFFHNLVVTNAVFPSLLSMDDLEHAVKMPGSMWDPAWNGQLSPGRILVILFFLALLSIGLGVSWKRWRLAGILPFLIYLSYNLATAVARTSGGRYIQPADWVALFYLAVGLSQCWLSFKSHFGAKDFEFDQPSPALIQDIHHNVESEKRNSIWKSILAGGVVFCISGLIVVTEFIFPAKFKAGANEIIINKVVDNGWASQLNLHSGDIERFLQSPDAFMIEGRALYPRYYGIDVGEPDSVSAYRAQGFPRLVITTIGPANIQFGVLPLSSSPEYFPNGVDVIMLGCKQEYNIDLAAIIITSPVEKIITRSPASPLECPMPEPVCNDNRECR